MLGCDFLHKQGKADQIDQHEPNFLDVISSTRRAKPIRSINMNQICRTASSASTKGRAWRQRALRAGNLDVFLFT
jgi:hypothetical protein